MEHFLLLINRSLWHYLHFKFAKWEGLFSFLLFEEESSSLPKCAINQPIMSTTCKAPLKWLEISCSKVVVTVRCQIPSALRQGIHQHSKEKTRVLPLSSHCVTTHNPYAPCHTQCFASTIKGLTLNFSPWPIPQATFHTAAMPSDFWTPLLIFFIFASPCCRLGPQSIFLAGTLACC